MTEHDVKNARPHIPAGGSGPRRRPLSRDTMPKRFMSLVGNGSTFQQTLSRLENPRLSAALGGKDLFVVATSDALLVMPRQRTEDTKRLVAHLQGADRRVATDHQRVYRPWGYYDSLDTGERFQVKCIVVNPRARLSLQKHFHRAEHWVVVRGAAEVTIDDKTMKLYENESVYIPIGATHRLANPGKIPLQVIEVQSGSYLGEDDIVRFEDDYHRDANPCEDDKVVPTNRLS